MSARQLPVLAPRPPQATTATIVNEIEVKLEQIKAVAEEEDDVRKRNMELAKKMWYEQWTGTDEEAKEYDANQQKSVRLQQKITDLEGDLVKLQKKYDELETAESEASKASTSMPGTKSTGTF